MIGLQDVIEFRPKPAHLVKPKTKSQPITVLVPNDEYELLASRVSPSSEPEKPVVAAQQPPPTSSSSTTVPTVTVASPSQQRNQQPSSSQEPKHEPAPVSTTPPPPTVVVEPVVVAKPVAVAPVAKPSTTPAASNDASPLAPSNDAATSPIATKPVLKWSITDVGYWIEHELGLEPIRAVFEDAEIDGRALLDLTAEELKDALEIKVLGHRKKILNGIKALQDATAGGATPAPAATPATTTPAPAATKIPLATVEVPSPLPLEATGSAAEQRDSIVGAPVKRTPSQGDISSPRARPAGRGEQFQAAPSSPRGGIGSPRGGPRGRGRGAARGGGGVTIPRPPSGQQIARPPQQQQPPQGAVQRPPQAAQQVAPAQQPPSAVIEEAALEEDLEDIPLRLDLTAKLVNFLLRHNGTVALACHSSSGAMCGLDQLGLACRACDRGSLFTHRQHRGVDRAVRGAVRRLGHSRERESLHGSDRSQAVPPRELSDHSVRIGQCRRQCRWYVNMIVTAIALAGRTQCNSRVRLIGCSQLGCRAVAR